LRAAGNENDALSFPRMQTLLTLIGIILLIAGLVFVGQGSGYFPYPPSSFMIKETRWVYYGGAIAVAGLLLTLFARR
jgi:hypothetical protein